MNTSLRLTFTCSLFALPLVACGDDGGATETNANTQGSTDDNTASATDATTTTGTATETTAGEPTTTDEPTATNPTTEEPGTTTEEPGTTTTTGPSTATEPETTVEPETSTTTTTGEGLSWETDVFPQVIEGNCGCHAQGSGGLTMTNAQDSYANIVGVASTQAAGFDRIEAGDPAASYLLAKVKGTAGEAPFNGSNGSQMPKGGPPLSPDTIALLEQWITEGAAP